MEADKGQRKEGKKYTTNLLVLNKKERVTKLNTGNLFPTMFLEAGETVGRLF